MVVVPILSILVVQLPPCDPVEFSLRLGQVTVHAPPVSLWGPTTLLQAITQEIRTRSRTLSDTQVAAVADAVAAAPVDPLLVLAVIRVESAYNHYAYSYVGAEGLMQVMPPTALWTAQRYGFQWRFHSFDPVLNVQLGSHYLFWLLELFDGDHGLALTAYNRGPDNTNAILLKYGGLIPMVREYYSDKVLRELVRLRGLYEVYQ